MPCRQQVEPSLFGWRHLRKVTENLLVHLFGTVDALPGNRLILSDSQC